MDCIVHPVAQRPDIGITWDLFEQAAGNGMVNPVIFAMSDNKQGADWFSRHL